MVVKKTIRFLIIINTIVWAACIAQYARGTEYPIVFKHPTKGLMVDSDGARVDSDGGVLIGGDLQTSGSLTVVGASDLQSTVTIGQAWTLPLDQPTSDSFIVIAPDGSPTWTTTTLYTPSTPIPTATPYPSATPIPTATPNSGDDTHFSTAGQIYTFVGEEIAAIVIPTPIPTATPISIPDHNDLSGIDGAGTYHITAGEAGGTWATLHTTGDLTSAGDIRTSGTVTAVDDLLTSGYVYARMGLDSVHGEIDILQCGTLDIGINDNATITYYEGGANCIILQHGAPGLRPYLYNLYMYPMGDAATNAHVHCDVIDSGTLSLDRFSAYDDLATESKIGTGAAQVAAGDHIHAAYAAKADYTSNTLIVAKSGGQYTSIQTAINAASAGMTVLVFPGTYAEKITMVDGVSLVGTDRENCIIEKSEVGAGWGGSHVLTTAGTNEIRNLTIENTYSAGYASTALKVAYGGDVKVINCDLLSSEADTVVVGGKSEFVNCYVKGNYDIVSVTGTGGEFKTTFRSCTIENQYDIDTAFWLGTGTFSADIIGCKIILVGGAGDCGIEFDNSVAIDLLLIGNDFRDTSGTLITAVKNSAGNATATITDAYNTYNGRGGTYATWVDPVWHGDLNVGGDVAVTGDLDITGAATVAGNLTADAIFYGANSPAGRLFKMGSNVGKDSPVIEFGYPTEVPSVVFDVNLYRGGTNELKTDDAFNANSLKIGGTEIISSGGTVLGTFDTNVAAAGVTLSGTTLEADGTDANIDITLTPKGTGEVNISKVDIDGGTIDGTTIGSGTASTGAFTTLSNTDAQWQMISAVDMTPLGGLSSNWALESSGRYRTNSNSGAEIIAFFNVVPGTIITDLRLKGYDAGSDGMDLNFISRRDDTDTAESYTVISSYSIGGYGSNFVYDFDVTNTTAVSGYLYGFKITYLKDAGGTSKIFSVGFKTSKRVQ